MAGGALEIILILAFGFGIVVSIIVVSRFRRVTREATSHRTDPSYRYALSRLTDWHKHTGQQLSFRILDSDSILPAEALESPRSKNRLRMKEVLTVYGGAALAYALFTTLISLPFIPVESTISNAMLLLAVYSWPAVATFLVVFSTSRYFSAGLVAGYFALYLILCLVSASLSNGAITLNSALILWIGLNGIPTALILLLSHDLLKGVAPLVLGSLIFAFTGIALLFEVLAALPPLQSTLRRLAQPFSIDAWVMLLIPGLLTFVVLLVLGNKVLDFLGRQYKAKRFSDQMAAIDAVWLLFATFQLIALDTEAPFFFLVIPLAFLLFKGITLLGFTLLGRRGEATRVPPRLLLLQPFSQDKRSRKSLANFAKTWRRTGPISMITHPGESSLAIEPHEFLEFIAGNYSSQFIRSQAHLRQRLRLENNHPDPDGLYRIVEYACHENTWQQTVDSLVASNDIVVVDLRSFSEYNRGFLPEIEHLLASVDLNKVWILIDDTTDLMLLKQSIQQIWSAIPSSSPNKSLLHPSVCLFQFAGTSNQEIQQLMQVLLTSSASVAA